jgi:hypothetical protein
MTAVVFANTLGTQCSALGYQRRQDWWQKANRHMGSLAAKLDRRLF